MASGFTSRIRVAGTVEVGQTVKATITPVCYNMSSASVRYGIGYENGNERAWKTYGSTMVCDEAFDFTFVVTQDMFDKQQAGNKIFVYATDSTSRSNIHGAGDGRTARIKIYTPGAEPIMGRVYVATYIRIRRSRRNEPICEIWADRYRNGILEKRSDDWGGGYCNPHGRVFDEHAAGFWSSIRYIRESLYNGRSQEEKDWLIARGVKVVPANWTPMLGDPIPKCTPVGELSTAPANIPILLVPGWGAKLGVDSLPVVFNLQHGMSCADVSGNTVRAPNLDGSNIPITFAVNGIPIATTTLGRIKVGGWGPARDIGVGINLASSYDLWAPAIKMGTSEITLTAQTEPKKIGYAWGEGDILINSVSASKTIPITEKFCDEGEERSPETCWDKSTVHKEICRNNAWVPSGETCSVDPCAGKKCPDQCHGFDLWREKCVDGVCVKDRRIEQNSPDCGYDPCRGVDCPDQCYVYNLHQEKCVDGVCVKDRRIEQNSPDCGYDPCRGVDCRDRCHGFDLYSEKCVDGICVEDELIKANAATCGYDPCEDVACPDKCHGVDLWSERCEDGVCVRDRLIERNSLACGYDPCTDVDCDIKCYDHDMWREKCVDGECVKYYRIKRNDPMCDYIDCDDKCYGEDLYTEKCVDGECVPDELLQGNSPTCGYDPCEGVDCPDECHGGDMWSERCEDGICVQDELIKANAPECEYLTPEQALERINRRLSCYIKSIVPLMNMLPGVPYSKGMWVPPLCAITAEP